MVAATTASLAARAKELDQQRLAAERRLVDIETELDAMPGSPGLDGGLVDKEGFPRADVDLYKARKLRQEHAMLRNDAKGLLAELHAAMAAVHESARNSGTATEGAAPAAAPPTPPSTHAAGAAEFPTAGPAFAVVTSVQPNSPASEAGLQEGDRVCQAGNVRASAGAVQAVAAQLQAWKGRQQVLMVERDGACLQLAFTPHDWSGRGLLGCVMSPL